MKCIIWLSNVRFSLNGLKGTGTWLQPLASALTSNYSIYHICCGNVDKLLKENIGGVEQYVLPNRKNVNNSQIPDKITCSEVKHIIDDINPDLIHVWGTESKWAYMNVLGIYNGFKVVLDMQGYLKSCYESYYAGLSIWEQIKCFGLKEFLRPTSSLFYNRHLFYRLAAVENAILKSYDYISYQSDWIRNRLQGLNLKAKLFPTKIIVRSVFFDNKWKITNNKSPIFFTSSAGTTTYKGLHILIKACSFIKQKYPDFRLYVAGHIMIKSHGVLSGYEKYLCSLIYKYKLTSNICFLGPLLAEEMIQYQLNADVCIVPSFVESYCLGLAESLALGVPSVVAYSAAMPTIAKDKDEVLFYSPMDYVDCAEKAVLLFENKHIASSLSNNSISRRIIENSKDEVIAAQMNIYKLILES